MQKWWCTGEPVTPPETLDFGWRDVNMGVPQAPWPLSPVHRLSSSLGDGRRETQASGRSDLRLVFSQVVGPADQAGRPTARLLIEDILGADFSVGAFIA